MVGHVELESRLFRQYWDDGLLDLFAGVGVLGIALCWSVGLVAVGAAVPAVLVPFWGPLRRAVVEPRMGLVEFTDERTGRTRRFLAGAAWLGVALLLALGVGYLAARSEPGELLRHFVPGLPALLLGLLSALVGVGLGLPRFLAYAGFLAVSGLAVAVAGAEPEIAMFAGGLAIALTGARLLRRVLGVGVESAQAD